MRLSLSWLSRMSLVCFHHDHDAKDDGGDDDNADETLHERMKFEESCY